MANSGFSPGDKVVDLAALLRSSALLTGAVTAAISLWLLVESPLWIVVALVAGGAGGYAAGIVIGREFYRPLEGHVMVVKLGPGALWPALQAGLIGGIVSGALAVVVPFLILADGRTLVQHLWIGLVAGIVVGAASAYVATRP
jgi:hypothetical protein